MGMQIAAVLQENPWLATALIAVFAVVGATMVHRYGRALLLRATRGSIMLQAVFAQTERAASAVLPLAALQAVWTGAPDNLRFIQNVQHVNGLLLIAALTWLAMCVITGVGNGVVARHPVTVEDNLQARRIQTQASVLARSASVVVLLAGTAMALMTFPGARQVGASLLASAGVVGLVAGIAARPVFSNLISGLQLALAQPIRMDDVLIVKGEWGRVEEITGTYVVLKIWDERRLVIPLQWFIENPFENWTRSNSQLLQSVYLNLDFATPLEGVRAEMQRLAQAAPEWDGRVCVLHVTDATEKSMKVRVLVSAANSGNAFELGCKIREGLIAYVAREHADSFPRLRLVHDDSPPEAAGESAWPRRFNRP
jgi:small-conductance mechanosensitive channel